MERLTDSTPAPRRALFGYGGHLAPTPPPMFHLFYQLLLIFRLDRDSTGLQVDGTLLN